MAHRTPRAPHHPREHAYSAVDASSGASDDDEGGAETIDLLRDSRWQPLTWFSDFAFATRRYSYGALFGTPSHLPPQATLRKQVLDSATEMETMQGGGAVAAETSTASDFLRRMMSKPTMLAIRFLGWVLGKLWRAAFTSVLLHNAGMVETTLKRADKRTALVILPTHRSHADYLLMSYIFFGLDLGVPLIAAGDNLNVSLLGSLLSRAGAFFIKRTSGTPRYRFVLQAYLQELAKSGAPIEFFVEGGRSRRGHVGKPKVGLLGIIVDLVRDGELSDALLIPCSLDYDAVPEAGSFANEVLGTGEKKPESLYGTIKGGIEWLLYGARGGSVYVGFADRPLSVKELLARVQRAQQGRALESDGIALNRPLAIFRGGSNTSLSGQDQDEMVVVEVGRLVAKAQRSAALVTVAGVVASVLLGEGKVLDREALCAATLGFVDLLVDLGYGNRIPKGTLTRATIGADVDRAILALGGQIDLKEVKARLRLRYVAAPVVCRLLPLCVASFEGRSPELGAWLGEVMDVDEEEAFSPDMEFPSTSSQARMLRTLVAPLIIILSAVLNDVATWRADAVVKEDLIVARVRDQLVACEYTETSASLEIISALRSCTSRGVLVRSKVEDPASKKSKYAYQQAPKSSEALKSALVAIDVARLALV